MPEEFQRRKRGLAPKKQKVQPLREEDNKLVRTLINGIPGCTCLTRIDMFRESAFVMYVSICFRFSFFLSCEHGCSMFYIAKWYAQAFAVPCPMSMLLVAHRWRRRQ